ncbi:MAG TPA: methylenetetrahydrofolate reductase, partial [Candidatus Omnitrophota bacterium]|nr:methylenetetrahydrofolate reductase [Candidatus Omnitrophota bacterium]
MTKVPEIFSQKAKTFSFELFPPKTEAGYQKLLETIGRLAQLKPDFISCTYGAGGGNREKTLDIAQLIQRDHGIPSVAHLTCVLNTTAQILEILKDIHTRGIKNILALRGDPPLEHPDWTPGPENFKYSFELCHFIRTHFKSAFGIGVAGF